MHKFLLLLAASSLTACSQNQPPQVQQAPATVSTDNSEPPALDFEPATVDDSLAQRVKDYLTTKYLEPNEHAALRPADRQFQLYQLDLNQDGKPEVFVQLNGTYFCGSGGCTILLLDSQLRPITRFTVTNPPFFVEQTRKNGWRVLLVKSQGEWKELTYTKGTYPANPSVVSKAPYAGPSAHATQVFADVAHAKTYTF